MLTKYQCIATTDSKRATAARDLDYFGTLIHEGWAGQMSQSTQDVIAAKNAAAQSEAPAYDEIRAFLGAL